MSYDYKIQIVFLVITIDDKWFKESNIKPIYICGEILCVRMCDYLFTGVYSFLTNASTTPIFCEIGNINLVRLYFVALLQWHAKSIGLRYIYTHFSSILDVFFRLYMHTHIWWAFCKQRKTRFDHIVDDNNKTS